jgi:hypothetical protein
VSILYILFCIFYFHSVLYILFSFCSVYSIFILFCIFCFHSVLYILFSFCSVYSIFIMPTGTLQLPWLTYFLAFSSVVRQMPGYNSQRRGMARTLPKLIMLFYILFVCKCVLYYCHWVSTHLQLTNISISETVSSLSSAPIQDLCETESGIWTDAFKKSVCIWYLAQNKIIIWTWWHNVYQNMYRKWLNIRWDIIIYLCFYLQNMSNHTLSISTLLEGQ